MHPHHRHRPRPRQTVLAPADPSVVAELAERRRLALADADDAGAPDVLVTRPERDTRGR